MTSQQMIDPREAFADALIDVAKKEERLVVLDADVSRTTRTRRFRDRYPDRFFDMGIAEQNMMATAAGLAASGSIPFAVSFAVFVSMRALEQVRTMICYPRLNVKIIGGYAGLSNGKDGATHQSTEDIAIMRSIANLVVIVPSDGVVTKKMVKAAVEYDGPIYMRLEYENSPVIYSDDFQFSIGKAQIVREGTDITIVTYGLALTRAVEAAELLASQGVAAEVIDAQTIKPFDEETLVESLEKTRAVVTLEDHSKIGGLASIVAETIASRRLSVRFRSLGINDVYTESGKNDELRDKFGIGLGAVKGAVLEIIAKQA